MPARKFVMELSMRSGKTTPIKKMADREEKKRDKHEKSRGKLCHR